jgi:hypothetical protein
MLIIFAILFVMLFSSFSILHCPQWGSTMSIYSRGTAS